MYRERTIDASRVLWHSAGGAASVIPADGCVDLILHDGELHIAGPSTVHLSTRADGVAPTVGVRFAPGAARDLLRIDLDELRDRFVPLGAVAGPARTDLLSTAMRRLTLASGHDGFALEVEPDGWTRYVRSCARRGEPVGVVLNELGWSERRFRRAMAGGFGYGYTVLLRIERASRARALILRGASLADTAALAGYADQPHLTREFQRLVGATPGQLAASMANRSMEVPSGSSTEA